MKNKIIISMNIVGAIPKVSLMFCTRSDSQLTIVGLSFLARASSQVAKGSDLYRADKSTKLCMVVA